MNYAFYAVYVLLISVSLLLFVPVDVFPDGYVYLLRNFDVGNEEEFFLNDRIKFFFDFRSEPITSSGFSFPTIGFIGIIYTTSCILTLIIILYLKNRKIFCTDHIGKYSIIILSPPTLLNLLSPSQKVLLLPITVLIIFLARSILERGLITNKNISYFIMLISIAVYIDTGDGMAITIYSVFYMVSLHLSEGLFRRNPNYIGLIIEIVFIILTTLYIGNNLKEVLKILGDLLPLGTITNEIADYTFYNDNLEVKKDVFILGYFLLCIVTGISVKIIPITTLIYLFFFSSSIKINKQSFKGFFEIFFTLFLLFVMFRDFRFLLNANYFYLAVVASVLINSQLMQQFVSRPVLFAMMPVFLLIEFMFMRVVN